MHDNVIFLKCKCYFAVLSPGTLNAQALLKSSGFWLAVNVFIIHKLGKIFLKIVVISL